MGCSHPSASYNAVNDQWYCNECKQAVDYYGSKASEEYLKMHQESKKIVLPEDGCITYQSLGIDPDAWTRPNEVEVMFDNTINLSSEPDKPNNVELMLDRTVEMSSELDKLVNPIPAFTVLLSHVSYSCYLESSSEWHRHWLVHCYAVSADAAHKAALDVFWTCDDPDIRELADTRNGLDKKMDAPPRRAYMECSLIVAGHVIRKGGGIPLIDVNGVLNK